MFDGIYLRGSSRYQVVTYAMGLPFLLILWYGIVPEIAHLHSLLVGIVYGGSLTVQADSDDIKRQEYSATMGHENVESSKEASVDVLQTILAPIVDSTRRSGFTPMAIIADGDQQSRSKSSRQISVKGEAGYHQTLVFLSSIRLQNVPIVANRILIRSDMGRTRGHYVEIDFVLQTKPESGFP